MNIQITPITSDFGAEITGVKMSMPVDLRIRDKIVTAMDRYAVCVIRGENVSEEEQINFAKAFGPLDEINGVLQTGIKRRVAAELVDISNMDENSDILGSGDRRRLFNLGNRLWHTDGSFKRIAAKYSMLHAHEVPPEAGETQVCDLRAAYDDLPIVTKEKIEQLVAVHSIFTSRAILGFDSFSAEENERLPPICRSIVRVHPGSKRQTLYLASHIGRIIGLPVAEGRLLIRDLIEHATQPKYIYTHRWSSGDTLLWDNRCTMHRAMPFDEGSYRRDMRRATVMETEIAPIEGEGDFSLDENQLS